MMPNPKSQTTFSHVLAGIQAQAVVRDSEYLAIITDQWPNLGNCNIDSFLPQF